MKAIVSKWSNLERDNPVTKLYRRKVEGEKALVAMVDLESGCEVAVHQHPNEQIAVVLSGRARWQLGEDRTEVETSGGDVLLLPPNEPHGLVALEDTVILDVFCPPGPMGVDTMGH